MARFDGSRVQTPDVPDSQPLQVADSSGLNFFAAAPRPVQDDNMERLADSLGSFSAAVQRFGTQAQAAQKENEAKQNKADMEAAQGLIASKRPDEWRQMVKDGKMPAFASPMAQLAIDRTTGQYAAHDLSNDLAAKVASGEVNYADGSAQTYLNNQRAAIIKANGWGETSGQMRGFGDAINNVYANVQTRTMQAGVELANEQHNQAAFQQIDMAMDNAFKNKLDPAATWAQLNQVRQGLVQTMHFEPKELDPVIFDALKRRAATDPNWVLAVGTAGRTDVDGKTAIPSLFSKNTYADQVQALQQHAQAFNAKADDTQQQGRIGAGVGDILNGPNPEKLADLPASIPYRNSVTGADGEVSKDATVKDQVNARLVNDYRRVSSGQATADQVQDEQLRTFARAGIKQPQWADTLNNAAAGGANTNSLTDPRQQASLTGALQLYSDLRTKNPAYLGTLVDGKTTGFFEDAYLQQTLFNKSPVEAMQAAALVNGTPKGDQSADEIAALRKQAASAASSLKFGQWTRPDIHNPEVLRDIVTRGAASMMKLNGMSADDAVKAAGDAANERMVVVNGNIVPDLHFLPKDQMEPAAERYLKDWAAGPAKALHLDPKSLSLSPVGPSGSGQYLIVDAHSGIPVSHGNGMSFVTGRDLISSGQANLDDAMRASQQRANDLAESAARVARQKTQDAARPVAPEEVEQSGLAIMP